MEKTGSGMKPSQMLFVLAAFIVVVAGMKASAKILVPFLLACFISILASPPFFWLQKKRVPTAIALILVVLGIFIVVFLVVELVASSVRDFSSNLPLYQQKLTQLTRALVAWLGTHGIDTSELALEEALNPSSAMRLISILLNNLRALLTNGFLILMTVVFILLEASSFPKKLSAILGNGEGTADRLGTFVENVKRYMAIKTIISFLTGALATGLTAVLGIHYPLLWGFLAFLLNYIPSIGSIIAAIPAVLLALVQFGPLRAMVVAIGYLIINLLMGSILEPRIMGKGLGLSTLVVFLSLVFWGWVLGPVGMLLSVPLTITAKIALDTREETRWLAVLLGPEAPPTHPHNSPKS